MYRRNAAEIADSVRALVDFCHGEAVDAGWWTDGKGESLIGRRNRIELLALMHSEISEALVGELKNRMDDHLPHRKAVEVELADAIIRICDYAGGFGLDLAGAIVEKVAYNRTRADHRAVIRALHEAQS